MAVRVVLEGKSIDVEDLPLEAFARIEKETGIAWYEVCGRPLANAAAGILLIGEAAAFLGVDVPPVLTPRTFVDMVEVDSVDSRPEGFVDGLPLEGATESEDSTI